MIQNLCKIKTILLSIIISFFFIISVRSEEIQPSLVQLQQYKTIYFLTGKPDTKIQISFKVQFIHKLDLFFAYSQVMMWDILKPSAPFRDINYNPELFYRILLKKESKRWIDIGVFEHESNGRDGESSRSWNRAYLLYHSMQKIRENKIIWSIKSWFPFSYENTNEDILEYRGLFETQITFTNIFGSILSDNELTLRFYPGGNTYLNPLIGGQELFFKSKIMYKAFTPNLIVGVFHGYAENMLDYNKKRFGLRVGASF